MKIGDIVNISDYSSASQIIDGKVVQSGGWNIHKKPQEAVVVAVNCVLPFAENYEYKHWPANDTIIHIPSDGRTLFIRSNQLTVKTKYCACCGQKV